MEFFAKVVNGFKPLSIFVKTSILYVWLVSKYASAIYNNFVTFQKYYNTYVTMNVITWVSDGKIIWKH